MEQNIFLLEYFKIMNYLYQLIQKYIKYFSGTILIDLLKSNEMPEKSIENITKPDSIFAPTFVDHHVLSDINFKRHY